METNRQNMYVYKNSRTSFGKVVKLRCRHFVNSACSCPAAGADIADRRTVRSISSLSEACLTLTLERCHCCRLSVTLRVLGRPAGSQRRGKEAASKAATVQTRAWLYLPTTYVHLPPPVHACVTALTFLPSFVCFRVTGEKLRARS